MCHCWKQGDSVECSVIFFEKDNVDAQEYAKKIAEEHGVDCVEIDKNGKEIKRIHYGK